MDVIKEGMLASAKAAEAAARIGERLFCQNTQSVMNFKSQICTDKNQSERLLALGLKKETADMCYKVTTHDFKGNEINEIDRHYTLCCWYNESSLVCGLERKETIPAWSLHRLMCLVFNSGGTHVELFEDDDAYEILMYKIEWLIKEGYFNKEYLV